MTYLLSDLIIFVTYGGFTPTVLAISFGRICFVKRRYIIFSLLLILSGQKEEYAIETAIVVKDDREKEEEMEL